MTTPTLRHSLFALMFAASTAVMVQIELARTWPELKQAVQERTGGQRYPMTGFDGKEVAEIWVVSGRSTAMSGHAPGSRTAAAI